jgi:protein TonB
MHRRQHTFNLHHALPGALATLVAAFLAGCSSRPQPPAPIEPPTPAQVQSQAKAPPSASSGTAQALHVSNAANPRAYRADAATHLYALNRTRIYKGRMPPLLYAIGTLQVEVDGRGNVHQIHWMRAPKHAPEVVAEIERTIRAAAPFPVPARMGKVVYTDTWLWHKSGKFQLDTLTEGQD